MYLALSCQDIDSLEGGVCICLCHVKVLTHWKVVCVSGSVMSGYGLLGKRCVYLALSCQGMDSLEGDVYICLCHVKVWTPWKEVCVSGSVMSRY